MKNAKVSILLPTLNSEQYISECLTSIVKQNYQNIEVIVIDGLSYDNTINIIKKFQNVICIRIIEKKTNNLASALNIGINNSNGDYIMRMDIDYIMRKKKILKQVLFLNKNNEYDVVGTNALRFSKYIYFFKPFLIYYKDLDLKYSMIFQCPFIHPTIMFRKKFLLDNNFCYNEDYNECEDYELWKKISKKTKFKNLHYYGIFYRVHKQSASFKKKKLLNNYFIKINDLILENNNIHLSEEQKKCHRKISSLDIEKKDNFEYLNYNIMNIYINIERCLSDIDNKKNDINNFLTKRYFRFCLRCINTKNFHPLKSKNNNFKISSYQYLILYFLYLFKISV